MDASFWHEKWKKGEIAFHASEVNALLIHYFRELGLAEGSRVLLPLCGKTRDIGWLLASGYQVVGVELSEIAVTELFKNLALEGSVSSYEVSKAGKLIRYSAKGIDIFVGDFFDATAGVIGSVEAIYDRAALVALPPSVREQYAAHLMDITDKAPQLLIVYEYGQELMDGPPFSISEEELMRHYADAYEVKALLRQDVAGGLKGKVKATESVFWLKHKQ